MTRNKVAALVYFEEGTTLAGAKKALGFLKDALERDIVIPHPEKPCQLDHAIVNEYDPEMGGPVWYIP